MSLCVKNAQWGWVRAAITASMTTNTTACDELSLSCLPSLLLSSVSGCFAGHLKPTCLLTSGNCVKWLICVKSWGGANYLPAIFTHRHVCRNKAVQCDCCVSAHSTDRCFCPHILLDTHTHHINMQCYCIFLCAVSLWVEHKGSTEPTYYSPW